MISISFFELVRLHSFGGRRFELDCTALNWGGSDVHRTLTNRRRRSMPGHSEMAVCTPNNCTSDHESAEYHANNGSGFDEVVAHIAMHIMRHHRAVPLVKMFSPLHNEEARAKFPATFPCF